MSFPAVTFPSNAHITATISKSWEIVAIVLLALWTIGCTTVPSEQLRAWERHEGKTNLLIFVHGFYSSKEQAWGSFIPLIKEDKDFNEFDILSYGYPQEICGQTNDIRDVGAHLKSDLTEELPKYDTTIFVGHSMGGLVILNSLLELGGSHATLISNKRLFVMTLGTPYYGAERASIFGEICRNPQGEAMKVLANEGGRLVRDWQQRATIPVYPFHGLKDDLVQMASACGIAPSICESLDGDHPLIAKPPDREHLTYKKLQSMKDKAGSKTIPPSEQKTLNYGARLLKTCGESSLTTRRAKDFVRYWVSVINRLYERNNQYHDFGNLMVVRQGMGIPRDSIGTNPDQEALFTLSCLEKMGYLKLEKFDPPRVYGAGVDNLKIIFSESMMPIPY
jgi:hypothetical protein